MEVIYVAGPYRAETTWGIECNTRAAEALALQVWQAGAVAICPHSNSRFFQGSAPDEAFVDGYQHRTNQACPLPRGPHGLSSACSRPGGSGAAPRAILWGRGDLLDSRNDDQAQRSIYQGAAIV
jgi:hypothetical protein